MRATRRGKGGGECGRRSSGGRSCSYSSSQTRLIRVESSNLLLGVDTVDVRRRMRAEVFPPHLLRRPHPCLPLTCDQREVGVRRSLRVGLRVEGSE